MSDAVANEFPLFPLGLVALPGELIPLHIFEDRYKTMMSLCIETESEFGIVWLADDGLRDIGCACEIDRVLEELEDGRMNLLTRGTRPFRVLERQGHLPYPAGVIEFVEDRAGTPDPGGAGPPPVSRRSDRVRGGPRRPARPGGGGRRGGRLCGPGQASH